MKIQCACGAKYSFDATPEMMQNPVRLVCQSCGLDLSESVNELIRQEFGGQAPIPPPPAPESPRLKISHAKPEPSAPVETAASAPTAEEHCPKHPRELAMHHCLVCGKPMCRQCMKLFGNVCSPLCRAKAEAQNINVPVYAGQSAVADARYWRKAGIIGGSIAVILVAALGFYTWYAWIGSQPHAVFSVPFDDRAYAGESSLCGTNQIVFLHGGTLARCDFKLKQQIWSKELVSKQQIADLAGRLKQSRPKDNLGRYISQDEFDASAARALEGSLQLQVSGQNIWVRTPAELAHYDWDTGKVLQEIPLAGSGEFIARNDEFLLVSEGASGQTLITHVNPATGESRAEVIQQPGQAVVSSTIPGKTGNPATGGLPLARGTGSPQPMNPAKVAGQAQNLNTPGRIALPAVLANQTEEERLEAELNEQEQPPTGAQPRTAQKPPVQNTAGYFMVIPSQNGCIEFTVQLLKSNVITREAMKAPSGKISVNEQLNEIQRERGGSTVQEDESLYQVSLRRPDSTGAADWTGQVTGPPALFSLKTVNVLAAGKTVTVFDQTNKKLWETTLTYKVEGGDRAMAGETSRFGEGPCVEHGDTLYIIDQAVLTAFDIATGNARWRLPSVGVVGLFFDDKGMLYVNTTTADPESIKYSRQVDLSQKIEAVLLKIDPQTGKTLWSVKPGGFISCLSGKYIYTVETFEPSPDEVKMAQIADITPTASHVYIRRLEPKNGQTLWEHYQARAPLDVQFENNTIALVFRKEVQVLKFISF